MSVTPLCPLHTQRLGPGAVCPVCTTAHRVRDLESLVVVLAERLKQVGDCYGSHAASITLELYADEITLAAVSIAARTEGRG